MFLFTFKTVFVFMRTKIARSTSCRALLLLGCFMCTKTLFYLLTCVLCFLCQTSNFLHLRCFYARLRLSLFLFAYVCFVLFVQIKSFCKRLKLSQYHHLLYYWDLFVKSIKLPQYHHLLYYSSVLHLLIFQVSRIDEFHVTHLFEVLCKMARFFGSKTWELPSKQKKLLLLLYCTL